MAYTLPEFMRNYVETRSGRQEELSRLEDLEFFNIRVPGINSSDEYFRRMGDEMERHPIAMPKISRA